MTASPIVLEAPSLTVCFVCTPNKVRELFANERLCEAGLLPRFLVVDPRARAQEIAEDRAGEARVISADVAQPYEAAVFACMKAYRLDANMEPHVIDMTAEARKRFAKDYNDRLKRTDGLPDPFQARLTEQAIRLSLIVHVYANITVEKRGAGTFGVKALAGHERPLELASVEAGIALRDWFERRQAEFLGTKREQEKENVWERLRKKSAAYPNGFTARDLYSGYGFAKNKCEAEALLALWKDEGRIFAMEPQTGTPGRRTVRYKLTTLSARG